MRPFHAATSQVRRQIQEIQPFSMWSRYTAGTVWQRMCAIKTICNQPVSTNAHADLLEGCFCLHVFAQHDTFTAPSYESAARLRLPIIGVCRLTNALHNTTTLSMVAKLLSPVLLTKFRGSSLKNPENFQSVLAFQHGCAR